MHHFNLFNLIQFFFVAFSFEKSKKKINEMSFHCRDRMHHYPQSCQFKMTLQKEDGKNDP